MYADYGMNALYWNDRMACSKYGWEILVEYQKVDYFKVAQIGELFLFGYDEE